MRASTRDSAPPCFATLAASVAQPPPNRLRLAAFTMTSTAFRVIRETAFETQRTHRTQRNSACFTRDLAHPLGDFGFASFSSAIFLFLCVSALNCVF